MPSGRRDCLFTKLKRLAVRDLTGNMAQSGCQRNRVTGGGFMSDSNEEERLWSGPLPATRVRKLPLEAVVKPTLPQVLLARQKRLKCLLGHRRIVAVC